jgi:hypothetical protein
MNSGDISGNTSGDISGNTSGDISGNTSGDISGNTPGFSQNQNIFNIFGNLFADTFRNVFMDELGLPLQQPTQQTQTTIQTTVNATDNIMPPVIPAVTTNIGSGGYGRNIPYTFVTINHPYQQPIPYHQLTGISGSGYPIPGPPINSPVSRMSISGTDISGNTAHTPPLTLENFIVNSITRAFNPSNLPHRNSNTNYQILRNRERRYNILNQLGNILNNPILMESNNLQFQNVLQTSLTNDTRRLMILKEEEYAQWEKKRYTDMPQEFKDNNKECSITMEEYTENDVVVKMPCGHTMSELACKDWFSINYKCPFCRREYDNRLMTDEEYAIYRRKLDNENRSVERPSNQGEEDVDDEATTEEEEDDIDIESQVPITGTNTNQLSNNQALGILLRNTLGNTQPITRLYYTNTNGMNVRDYEALARQEELDLQRAIEESMRSQGSNG